MPIKGATDGIGFPEIGRIRKGAKKPEDGRSPGKDLDYFRIEFGETEEDSEKWLSLIEAAYGKKPNFLEVLLPFDEVSKQWDANYEEYTAGSLVAISDGETIQYQADPETGAVIVKNGLSVATGEPVPYVEGEPAGYFMRGKGKKAEKVAVEFEPYGRLKVILPVLQRLGHLMLVTSSWNDIRNISESLAALSALNGGKLAGIPMILSRKPKQISVPMKGGKKKRMQKHLISIEAKPAWVKNMLASGALDNTGDL